MDHTYTGFVRLQRQIRNWGLHYKQPEHCLVVVDHKMILLVLVQNAEFFPRWGNNDTYYHNSGYKHTHILVDSVVDAGSVVVGLAVKGLAEVGLAVAAGLVAEEGLAEMGVAEGEELTHKPQT